MKMKKETSPNVSQFNDQSPEKIDDGLDSIKDVSLSNNKYVKGETPDESVI